MGRFAKGIMPMSSTEEPYRRVHPLRSLFFQCTLMLAICVTVMLSVMEWRDHHRLQDYLRNNMTARALETGDLIAFQSGGAAGFPNEAVLAETVANALSAMGPDLVGAVVFDNRGQVLFSKQMTETLSDTATAKMLADEAIRSGEVGIAAEQLTFAHPVWLAQGGTPAGAIVLNWTSAHRQNAIWRYQLRVFAFELTISLISMTFACLFLKARISKPLKNLVGVVRQIGNREFDTVVPQKRRNDEIGLMARQIDAFRVRLKRANDAQIEMAFKGAAYVGSTAAMMVVDRKFNVMALNPACEKLFRSLGPELGSVWGGITPQTLIGADLGGLKTVNDELSQFQDRIGDEGDETETVEFVLRIGCKTIVFKTNPALDAERKLLGFVLEWNDLTETLRNAALINAIESSHLTVEFGADGSLATGNQNFLNLIGAELGDTTLCSFSKMFANNLEGDETGAEFAESVMIGTTTSGAFKVKSSYSDKDFVLDGSFALVQDENNAIERVIFIATDATVHENARQRVRAEQSEAAAAQSKAIDMLGRALNGLAEGNLEVKIDDTIPETYAQLKQDFDATVKVLHGTISTVIHNSASIRSETSEITSAADDLSRRTETQAATLEETAAALDQLTVSVRSAAEGADEASTMSFDARKNAAQGGEVAREAVSAMDGIRTSSQEISKITSVIDDIAFQTNLLALNAGVEAARAGEAGRGFAVVATEVRALAQRSSEAAREINALINSSADQVNHGVDLVNRTGTALESIVISISDISTRVSDIASSAREQSAALAQINVAVNELDHVTQQNAAMFQQTTAASHALTSEADALVAAISGFKLDCSSPQAAPPAPKEPAIAPDVPSINRVRSRSTTAGSAAVDLLSNPETDGWEEF